MFNVRKTFPCPNLLKTLPQNVTLHVQILLFTVCSGVLIKGATYQESMNGIYELQKYYCNSKKVYHQMDGKNKLFFSDSNPNHWNVGPNECVADDYVGIKVLDNAITPVKVTSTWSELTSASKWQEVPELLVTCSGDKPRKDTSKSSST